MAYCPLVDQGPVGPDCPTPQRRFGVDLWVVGGSSRPKTALFNVCQACSIGFMFGKHAGHSSLAMLLSWNNSFTRCPRWGRELSSIKTNSSPKFCRYGCTIGRRMSFLYRTAVSALSMTTSGVRRPHIMPPQNIREPPRCCTRWTVCLRRSSVLDCLQTRLRRLSGWIELDTNCYESIQRVIGPICTALHCI